MTQERSANRRGTFLASFVLSFVGALAVFFAVWFILCIVFAFAGLPVEHDYEEGLYLWDPVSRGEGEISVEPEIKREFFLSYPYSDGNYHDDEYVSWFGKNVSRRFVWLTYDDPDVYRGAKQSHMEAQLSDRSQLVEREAFGFVIYTYDQFIVYQSNSHHGKGNAVVSNSYPRWFYAFGYNDETRTLIFFSFRGHGWRENKYIALGDSDFPAFLDHYYGGWFDWEAGNRAPK